MIQAHAKFVYILYITILLRQAIADHLQNGHAASTSFSWKQTEILSIVQDWITL
jgi:hypothetical protein